MTGRITLPAPRTPTLGEAPVLGWGILGPGTIAATWAESVLRNTGQKLMAVGGRSASASADFASRFAIPRSYGSAIELMNDPAVDIVYISTPNSAHFDGAMLALEAGKHVLVEKSFASTAGQASMMVREAERRDLFIMEGLWTRFLPFMDTVRQAVNGGLIGDLLGLTADLGDHDPYDPSSRMYSPALGGGITHDRGIYLVALSSDIMGQPAEVRAVGRHAPTGVDTHLYMTLGNGHGAHSQLTTSMLVKTPSNTHIFGTGGSIELEAPWYLSPEVRLRSVDGRVLDTFRSPLRSHVDALCFEVEEAARVIRRGEVASPLMPGRESVEIALTLERVLDAARSEVVSPGE